MWSNRFIGLPWKEFGRDSEGYDCWGLVREVILECRGIELPSFVGDYETVTDRDGVSRFMSDNAWSLCNQIESGKEQEFDIVRLREGGFPCHVGIVVDRGRMLHIRRGRRSDIARYTGMIWRDRIEDFWRPIDLKVTDGK